MSYIAQKLILHAKNRGENYLDLGNCGLTSLPKELFELVWLKTLILSNEWWDGEQMEWSESQNKGKPNALKKLPNEIGKLKHLEKLVLGGSRDNEWEIEDLSPLRDLLSLKELDFSFNKVSNLAQLENLTNLKSLNFSNNKVNDIKSIALLHRLSRLCLRFNRVSDLKPIENLSDLISIDFSFNQVSDLEPLKNQSRLIHLEFRSNRVTDLKALEYLTNLTILDFRSNDISDLSPLKKLTALAHLVASDNKINNLDPLRHLHTLTSLNLWNNKIVDLKPLEQLTELTFLNLQNNSISDLRPILPIIKKGIPVKWSKITLDKGQGIYLQNCPLTSPPPEIVRQGMHAILNYFNQIEEQGGSEEIIEAKIIIVGEGGTGKTTLFKKLENATFNPLQYPTDETHGINILEGVRIWHKDLGNRVFLANLWDFGGQELQYMTHQFFLTPQALYILLMEARTEMSNLSYWFKIISLLGKDCEDSSERVPLILVFNKRKNSSGTIPNYQTILQYYEAHLDTQLIEVDLAENDHRFENLIKTIENSLINLPIVRSKLPQQWKPIRDTLRKTGKTQPYITTKQLSEICATHQIDNEENQMNLSRYLHQTGSLLHFQNDEALMDLVILNPEWAIGGVYCFLKNEKIAKQNGRFTVDDVFEVLKHQNYSRIDAQKILQLMTRNNFDICYKSSEGNYVAAQLLPDQEPKYTWYSQNGALQFRYQYPVMPKGLLSRLIVRMSDYLELDAFGREMVWKKGAILRIMIEKEECRILIRENEIDLKGSSREIVIEVMGEPQYRKYALRRVRDQMDELHRRWFRNLRADELVPCCCLEACKTSPNPYLHPLSKLLNLKYNRNKKTAECGNSGSDILIEWLLEGVYDLKEIKAFSDR